MRRGKVKRSQKAPALLLVYIFIIRQMCFSLTLMKATSRKELDGVGVVPETQTLAPHEKSGDQQVYMIVLLSVAGVLTSFDVVPTASQSPHLFFEISLHHRNGLAQKLEQTLMVPIGWILMNRGWILISSWCYSIVTMGYTYLVWSKMSYCHGNLLQVF